MKIYHRVYKFGEIGNYMDKSILKSKTVWGCVLGIAGIIGMVIRGEMDIGMAIPPIMAFVSALGIRDAL